MHTRLMSLHAVCVCESTEQNPVMDKSGKTRCSKQHLTQGITAVTAGIAHQQ